MQQNAGRWGSMIAQDTNFVVPGNKQQKHQDYNRQSLKCNYRKRQL